MTTDDQTTWTDSWPKAECPARPHLLAVAHAWLAGDRLNGPASRDLDLMLRDFEPMLSLRERQFLRDEAGVLRRAINYRVKSSTETPLDALVKAIDEANRSVSR